jgi:cell division protein FtsN
LNTQTLRNIKLVLIGAALIFAGCVSSEETGAGDKAINPLQIFGSIDTVKEVNHSLKQKTDTSKRSAPIFKSNQDTLLASVVKKTKSTSRQKIKNEHSENPAFTVQIGAYSDASHALRVQKQAKAQFVYQPVYNRFIKSANMYRVSIGRYEDRKDALALCDSMKQKYPKEYEQCWINSIH